MGSSRDLKWAIDQDGETRRSEDELAEEISRGMSLEGRRSILMKQTQGGFLAKFQGPKQAKRERGTGLLTCNPCKIANQIFWKGVGSTEVFWNRLWKASRSKPIENQST
jgi:hypothetical protein